MNLSFSSEHVVIEHVRVQGGSYSLEGELVYPETETPTGAVVLAGPHPLLGGTRRNNVVRALSEGLAGRGWATLRFDYRAGTTDQPAHFEEFWHSSRTADEDEHAEDLRQAVEFLIGTVGRGLPLALVGYSFGCALVPRVALSEREDVLVFIAPTAGIHDLDSCTHLTGPKLVIAPLDDFACDEAKLLHWFTNLRGQCEMVRPRLDGHFFRGHEDWLGLTVSGFIDRQWRNNGDPR